MTTVDAVAAAVEALRGLNLYKPPGVAETIDWANALGRLGALIQPSRAVVLWFAGGVARVGRDPSPDQRQWAQRMAGAAFLLVTIMAMAKSAPSAAVVYHLWPLST